MIPGRSSSLRHMKFSLEADELYRKQTQTPQTLAAKAEVKRKQKVKKLQPSLRLDPSFLSSGLQVLAAAGWRL